MIYYKPNLYKYNPNEPVTEWCAKCFTEVNLKPEFKIQVCPNCKQSILPCSMCIPNKNKVCGRCPLDAIKKLSNKDN